MWNQLTREKRIILAELLRLKLPKTRIAERLGVDRSTIYRELKRNSGPMGYQPEECSSEPTRGVGSTARGRCATPCWGHVRERLEHQWSPDQIAGRTQLDFPRNPQRHVSRQTIYDWIEHERRFGRRRWRECLRFGKPRRKRSANAGRLPGAVSIEGRPRVADLRRRFGDWEGDTIIGRGRRGGLVSLVERKSGYTLLRRVEDLCADTVRERWHGDCGHRPNRCAARRPLTTARNSPSMNAWPRPLAWRCTSRNPTRLGSVVRTKTPTAWCDNTTRKALTWRLSVTVK